MTRMTMHVKMMKDDFKATFMSVLFFKLTTQLYTCNSHTSIHLKSCSSPPSGRPVRCSLSFQPCFSPEVVEALFRHNNCLIRLETKADEISETAPKHWSWSSLKMKTKNWQMLKCSVELRGSGDDSLWVQVTPFTPSTVMWFSISIKYYIISAA